MRTTILLLAALVSAGCASMVTSAMNQAVAEALDTGDGTLRLSCRAGDVAEQESATPGPGTGVVALALAPIGDERRQGDTLTWVQEREVFGEGDGDAWEEIDDQTAQVLKPGLRRAAARDLPVLLARRNIVVVDSAGAPEGSTLLQATLIRSDVTYHAGRRDKRRRGLRGVVVLDLEVGSPGSAPSWSRTFTGDTLIGKGQSSGDFHYEQAFGVAWCGALRQAAAAMDSADFRRAVEGS
ncbi:MAG: hypothetical protein JNM53_15565 [Gemmatimonadetes bacterium]|nr:hypothetical protein [Gemmatimonadota bacterium]